MSTKQQFPDALPVMHRAATVESIDAEKRTVTFALTSEQPVKRWFGYEILDHKPSSIRQDRLKRGMPLLFGHASDGHLGRLEAYGIANGKLTVTGRFGNSALANEKFRDVQDNILVDASGGYIVHEARLESRDDQGVETWRVTDWEPVEGSLVTIPADPTVGLGRKLAAGTPTFPVRALSDGGIAAPASKRADGCTCDCPECEDGNCADCSCEDCDCDGCTCDQSRALKPTQPAQAAKPQEKTRMEPITVGPDAITAERQRVSEINALSRQYPKQITHDQAEKFINADTTVSDVRKHVLDAQIKDAKDNEVRNLNIGGLTDKDKENYSILRAFSAIETGNNSFELEISQEIGKKLGREARSGGFYIPMDARMKRSDNERGMGNFAIQQRAGLDATTSTKGPETVFTEYVSLIELLRNKMLVRTLGATVLSGLSDTIAFPKQASAATAYWVADNPGSDVADSNLTFSQITMSPKLLQSSTSYSRKLLLQSSVDVEALVRNDLMAITALAIDLAALNGSGTSNQPKGIFNQTGIGSVLTANAALSKSLFVDLETAVAAANADIGTAAYLTDAAVRGKLKKTPELGNTIALPVWYKGEVNDTRAEISQQMPTFAITTPATYTGHGIVYGIWNQLMVGEWGALEVIVDPYRLKKQGMVEITTFDTCDVNVRHPESFAVCTDANPLS